MMQRLGLAAFLPAAQRTGPGLMPPGSLGAAIGASLAAHLEVAVAGRAVIPGPRVVAFGYHLDGLTPALMRAATSPDLAAVLEHNVGVEWLQCHRARGLFWYSVPNPAPYQLSATAFAGTGLEAAIGVDRMAQPVDVDLARTPHLLLAMPTGGGKTTAAQALIYRLCEQNAPRDLRLIVVASRLSQWRPLESLPHLWGIVHHNDSAPVLDWVLREIERREALGVTLPRIVLVLDDAHSMVTRGGIAVETMTTASQNARAAGIHLVITAHGTDARNLGSADVERNIERRIVAATSASNAAQMTGRGRTGAHRLLGRGEAISVDGPSETPVTLAVVAPDDFAALGARWGMADVQPAPWAEAEKPKPTGTLIRPATWRNAPPSASEAEPEAETEAETTPRLLTDRERHVRDLLRQRATQADIMAAVWNVTPGGGGAYKAACNEYRDVLARLLEDSA